MAMSGCDGLSDGREYTQFQGAATRRGKRSSRDRARTCGAIWQRSFGGARNRHGVCRDSLRAALLADVARLGSLHVSLNVFVKKKALLTKLLCSVFYVC
jgi:hypothetical protein